MVRRGVVRTAVAVLAAAAVLRLLGALDTVVVRGSSMAPTLRHGDRLLVMRMRGAPRVGALVLSPDPRDGGRELVKRVAAIDATGVALRGDNPNGSTDGRTFGPVATAAITWRVVARYWPLRRLGFAR